MATIYDALRLLRAFGWRQKARIGLLRILHSPVRPGVMIFLEGEPGDPLPDEVLKVILENAGIEEQSR